MAIEPPLTLTIAGSTPKACWNRKTTAAKASFTSNRSISPMVSPASARIFSVTGTGPVSMMVGSVPIFAVARMRARGFRPWAIPNAASPIRMAAAPSTIPLELPAWWMWLIRSKLGYFIKATLSNPGMTSPISLKAGFKAPKACMSVPGRMYSSCRKISNPLRSLMVTTERLNRPSFHASAALRWLSIARASASSRENPYCVAMISAEMPCGTK